MRIAIVGAGTAGTAVAVRGSEPGTRVTAVAGRTATPARAAPVARPASPSSTSWTLSAGAELVVLGVPDDALPRSSRRCSRTGSSPARGSCTLSGAQGLGRARAASNGRARGVLALHPLQTFADVAGAIDALSGCRDRGHRATTTRGSLLGERLAARSRRPAVPAAPTSTAPCTTRPPCSRRTTWSRCRARRSSCSRAAGVPDAAGGDAAAAGGDARQRRTGWARATRSPARPSAATPATIDRNLAAIAAVRRRRWSPAYVTLCRTAMDVAGDASAGRRAGRAIEEVLGAVELMRDAAALRAGTDAWRADGRSRSGSCRRWARCTRDTRSLMRARPRSRPIASWCRSS